MIEFLQAYGPIILIGLFFVMMFRMGGSHSQGGMGCCGGGGHDHSGGEHSHGSGTQPQIKRDGNTVVDEAQDHSGHVHARTDADNVK